MGVKKNVIKRDAQVISFREAVDEFEFHQRAKGLAEASIATFNWIVPVFMKDMDIEDDTPITILNEKTFDAWKLILINDRQLTAETTNSYIARMRTMTYWCIRNNYIPEFKISLVKMQEQPIKVYTDEELKILLMKPNKSDFIEYRTWLITAFMLATGARAGTVRFIKWEDVNFAERTVAYRHLKNRNYAIVPIPDSLCKMLLEYKSSWDTGTDWLFCEINSGQLTTSAIRQALNKYCKKRGVPAYGPHALRHSFAKGWITNGGGEFQLMTMMTHSTLAMTKRYVKLFSTDLQKDVKAYNPLDSLRQGSSRTKNVTKNS